MVPPPDNTGDEFPDFENMSVEDQMAWLESLARRQGAGEDELTTSADLDIPTPEDTEVDEPGYVPFEGSRSAREMQQAEQAVPTESPASEPESDVGEVTDQEQEEPPHAFEAPAEAFAEETDAESAEDPMHWLDSLAAQPDPEDPGIFDAQEVDTGDDELPRAEAEELADMEAEVESLAEASEPEQSAEAEAVTSEADDPLGGMDPMLWLESLAARQGADASGFTTAADMEIEEGPEDFVVDEPGYVPFEGSRSAREMQQLSSERDVQEPEEVPPTAETIESEAAAQAEPEKPLGTESFDEGVADDAASMTAEADESMEWLESLAKRQGASEDELLTPADLDVPELPEDTVVDEPGYVAYDPLSIRPPAAETARSEMVDEGDDTDEMEEMLDFSGEEADEGLSWLEDLAAVPDEDVADFFAFEAEIPTQFAAKAEPESEKQASEAEPATPDTVSETSEADDLLADMTDAEVAQAQAEGTLTPQQELAWLKRQARTLAETRETEAESDEIVPAEPGDLPQWLEDIRQATEDEVATVAAEVLDDVAAESDELLDWLDETESDEPPPAAIEPEDFDEATEVALDEDVESLWAETVEPEQAAAELDMSIPDSELVAFISGDFVPDEVDPLAEALDEEYDRRASGSEEEPDWYTAAVAKVASDAPPLAETEADEISDVLEDDEAVLAAAEPADVPGWLAEETELQAIELPDEPDDSDMPDWLRGADEEEPVAIANDVLPDWLAAEGELTDAELEDLPDWLAFEEPASAVEPAETAIEPVPEPEPPTVQAQEEPSDIVQKSAPEPPEPVSEVEPEVLVQVQEAALPEGELFEQYRERLEANANDHPSRLALARALRSDQQPELCLDHYEMLIEAGQLLDDVSADLVQMVEAYPDQPRMRRVLGDAYMRQGKLAQALTAYREALHRL